MLAFFQWLTFSDLHLVTIQASIDNLSRNFLLVAILHICSDSNKPAYFAELEDWLYRLGKPRFLTLNALSKLFRTTLSMCTKV